MLHAKFEGRAAVKSILKHSS